MLQQPSLVLARKAPDARIAGATFGEEVSDRHVVVDPGIVASWLFVSDFGLTFLGELVAILSVV